MDDDEVFAEVVPGLRRFAAVVCPPDRDLDDLLQEALVRTLRQGPLSERDEPLPYLRRVVANLAADHRRAFVRRRAKRHMARPTADSEVHHDDHVSDLDELRSLPVAQRAVVYLVVVEGLSHREVAHHLGISVESSRSRLSRGLHQLRLDHRTEEVPS
jgi:RNA polymerase sigma factor (sigma-70 family)